METNVLIEKILEAREAYYRAGKEVMSDGEYDLLVEELKKKDPYNPILGLVGDDRSAGFNKVPHPFPVLSLSNSMESKVSGFDDVQRRVKKWLDVLFIDRIPILIETKLDGCSAIAHYRNGMLEKVVSRGNGLEGDDITHTMKDVEGLPAYLGAPFTGWLRGEVCMTYAEFERINDALEEPYSHPRALVAGTIKSKKRVADRKLWFYTHDIRVTNWYDKWDDQTRYSHLQTFGFLEGVIYPQVNAVCISKDNLEHLNYVLQMAFSQASTSQLPFDGLVVKANMLIHRDLLMETSHHPNWAFAVKQLPQVRETILQDIFYQTGRTGAMTPVARFEPVVIDGSSIMFASLASEQVIKDMDLQIGDEISVMKAGMIIPYIVSARRGLDSQGSITKVPTCSECGAEAIGGADWPGKKYICPNPSCSGKMLFGTIYALGLNALNVKGFGEVICRKAVAEGYDWKYIISYLVRDDVDEIRPIMEALDISIPSRMFEKLVDNVHKAISQAPLWRWIAAMGIPRIGKQKAKDISRYYETLDDFLDDLMDDKRNLLSNVPQGVLGEADLLAIEAFYANGAEFIQELEALSALLKATLRHTVMSDLYEGDSENRPLAGKKFVITGTLSKGREQIQTDIERVGGKVMGSVSKATDYVVVGDDPGQSKIAKAGKLDIPQITEEQLNEMLNNAKEAL